MRRSTGTPSEDAASEGVDDKRYINKALPSGHIGKVRDPQHVRVELAFDVIQRSSRHGAVLSLTVVLTGLPRVTPRRCMLRISRSTVQRAMSKPSRLSRQTLRTP
jgi:hypothetical protein